MADDQTDIAQKLRDDINKAIDDIHSEPLNYDSHEKVAVVVINALMDFHEQRAFLFRTDFEGMVKLTREAREKLHLEERASGYPAKDRPDYKPAVDLQEIHTELQILEYIELNKRPLTEWERNRQAELNKSVAEHEADKKDLQDLETKLYSRQLKERTELEKNQQAEVKSLGPSEQLDRQHLQARIDQTVRFEKERDRYVDDYYAAKRMREEMQRDEQKQTLEPDKKLTR